MPLPPNSHQAALHPTTVSPIAEPSRRRRGLITLLFLMVVLVALGGAVLFRLQIHDWYRLRGYAAPAAVASLATQDTMNEQTRRVFYVNHPALQSKQEFTRSCPNNGGEQSIILGCYRSDQNSLLPSASQDERRGIYLLTVDDSRLSGVEQVTAAHETLHALYDRLGSGDRRRIDTMLLDYYNHGLHDDRIRKTIDAYKTSEPHDVVNEMHSIFGTEIVQLPSNLEQYYKRYFTNRQVIAQAAQRYQSEFTSRQAIVAQDDVKLKALKSQIDAGETSLKAQQQQIESRRASLEAQRQAGNTSAYNAGVPVYNALIDGYNGQVQTVRNSIGQYNQLVADRNAVAVEVDQLVNDLNASSVNQIQN